MGISAYLDHCFYKHWTLTQWNFVKFNLISGISSFYGTHPWHWYLTQGLPAILFTFLPFTIHGLDPTIRNLLVWTVGTHSLIGHKEFRFLGPMLPLCLISAGKSLFTLKTSKLTWFFLSLSQFVLGFYLARFHQRGVVDVTGYLRHASQMGKVDGILFLMPCHSTPFYSHVHSDVPMDFLGCDPPWEYVFARLMISPTHVAYRDETREFYSDPSSFIHSEFSPSLGNKTLSSLGTRPWPSHLIFFEALMPVMRDVLKGSNYKEVIKIENSTFRKHDSSTVIGTMMHGDAVMCSCLLGILPKIL